jgi:hypothetical protein
LHSEGALLKSTGDAGHNGATPQVLGIRPRRNSLAQRCRRNRRPWRRGTGMALAVGVLGWFCGGCTPAGPAGPTGQTITLPIVFDRTGTLTSDGFFGSVVNNSVVQIGDGADNKAARGFVSVNLSSIPTGANVTSAVLRFSASSDFGNPFGDFVTLTVDHVNVVTEINTTAFDGNVLTKNIAPFPALPADGTVQTRELDITAELKADLAAGRPISSYRFEFKNAPTQDGQADVVTILAIASDATSQPSALVTLAP